MKALTNISIIVWPKRNGVLSTFSVGIFVLGATLSGQNSVGVRTAGTGVVKDSQVWVHSRSALYAIGDRMLRPGKERTVLSGSLVRGTATTVGTPIQIYGELSGKVRVQNSESGLPHIVGSDGNSAWSDKGQAGPEDDAFIETFLNDTIEHFLELQASGAAMRFYGANFRFDDGTTANYTGPYYDVYEISDSVLEAGKSVQRSKVFCINSKTKLLERVQYSVSNSGGVTKVETVLSGWQAFNGQQFPTLVTRIENGKTVWSVTVKSAASQPTDASMLFSQP